LDLGYLDMLLACGGVFEAATLSSGAGAAGQILCGKQFSGSDRRFQSQIHWKLRLHLTWAAHARRALIFHLPLRRKGLRRVAADQNPERRIISQFL
jgi:hypothetical protein